MKTENKLKEPTPDLELELARKRFQIEAVYFKPVNKKSNLVIPFIPPLDNHNELQVFFSNRQNDYQIIINRYQEECENLLLFEESLVKENKEIEKLIKKYENIRDDRFSLIPGLIDKGDQNYEPYPFSWTSLPEDHKLYLKDHFQIRLQWLYELDEIIDAALIDVRNELSVKFPFKKIRTRTAELKIATIWKSLESAGILDVYSKEERSFVRRRFFELFGFTDKTYRSKVNIMKEAHPDTRVAFLNELIEALQNEFKDSKKASVRKALAKQKQIDISK